MAFDRYSDTWKAVEAHCRSEMSRDLGLLEQRAVEPGTTEYLRGRIKALREVLALAEPKKQQPTITTDQ